VLDKVRNENRSNLIEPEAMEILQIYGFPVPKFRLARNVKEAVQARQQVGASVAAKICSPQIVHKSEASGVMLNLRSPTEVKKAYSEIMKNALIYCSSAKIEGILISEMLSKGMEVIIGGIRDPQFGPVVMFGLGGIFVEILKDVSFRVAPIGEREAFEMVQEVKGYPVLQGIRGEKPRDIPVIVDLIVKVSRLLCDHPDIQEIDLNPVFSYEKGATVADARIILAINAV
jgi:acetyl-CoA synthetase (ADP-forming)